MQVYTPIVLTATLLLTVAVSATPTSSSRVQAQFDATFALLEQADDARASGDRENALRLYGAALSAYEELAQRHPRVQPELVEFRIHYCRSQIQSLAAKATSPPQELTPTPAVARPLTAPVVESIALCRTGQFELALAALADYVPAHPDDAVALLMMSTAQLGIGKSDEAIRFLRKALEADDELAEAHYNLSQLLIRQIDPDFESARGHYLNAIRGGVERDPNLEAVLDIDN